MARIFRLAERTTRFQDAAIAATPAHHALSVPKPKPLPCSPRSRRLEYSPVPSERTSLHIPRTRPFSVSPSRRLAGHSHDRPASLKPEASYQPCVGQAAALQPRKNQKDGKPQPRTVKITTKSAALSRSLSADSGTGSWTGDELFYSHRPSLNHPAKQTSLDPGSASEAAPSVELWLASIEDRAPLPPDPPGQLLKAAEPNSTRARLGSFLLGSTPRRARPGAMQAAPQSLLSHNNHPTRFKAGPIPAPLRKHLRFRKTGPVTFGVGPSTSDLDSDHAKSLHSSRASLASAEEPQTDAEAKVDGQLANDMEEVRLQTRDKYDELPTAHLSPTVSLRRGRSAAKGRDRCPSYLDEDITSTHT